LKKTVICGKTRLNGEIHIHGAKNSLLPILAAVILTNEDVCILNCPPLTDVKNMLILLEDIGVKVKYEGNKALISPKAVKKCELDSLLMCRLRSSIFMLGPMLARLGRVELGYPGGCDIGIRPIDLHLKGLRDLGVDVKRYGEKIICTAEKLTGGEIYLDYPSVGATENIMMASVLADGATIIQNAAKEPEIVDLQEFINKMGGCVRGAGTDRIIIHGRQSLHGCEYSPIPDRIVTGTFMLATGACGGEVFINNGIKEHLSALIAKLRECGCDIDGYENGIRIASDGRLKSSRLIETLPYPGFPTDLQSQMMTLQAVCEGTCVLIENVFENRFKLAQELKKMGADITIKDRTAIINGVKSLHGATVFTHDLRSAASLIIAGLIAEGNTTVIDNGLLDRGYFEFEKQLNSLGASISVSEEINGAFTG